MLISYGQVSRPKGARIYYTTICQTSAVEFSYYLRAQLFQYSLGLHRAFSSAIHWLYGWKSDTTGEAIPYSREAIYQTLLKGSFGTTLQPLSMTIKTRSRFSLNTDYELSHAVSQFPGYLILTNKPAVRLGVSDYSHFRNHHIDERGSLLSLVELSAVGYHGVCINHNSIPPSLCSRVHLYRYSRRDVLNLEDRY